MRRVIVFVSLLVVLSLFAFDEDFPFGMNFSVYKTFKDTTPELTEYIWKYKAAMDSTAYGLGVGWWRAQLKFRWGDMQPYEGEWVWDDEDSLVKWTGERGMHILPCFGYTASWAGNLAVPYKYRDLYPPDPSKWSHYKAYVDFLVERYDGDGVDDYEGLINPVKYWECMNEPYGKYFYGTPEGYVEMFDSARVAIKSADSEGKIGGPCLTGVPSTKFDMDYPDMCYWAESKGQPLKWLYYDINIDDTTTYLFSTWENAVNTIVNDMIGIDNVDFVTFHIYHKPYHFMEVFRDLKGIVGWNKPVWITEVGYQKADPMRVDTRKYPEGDPQGPIAFTPDANGVFWDNMYILYSWGVDPIFRADTFLHPGDTVHLNFDGKDEYVIYDGGPLRWSDNTIAVDIGDSLNIFHLFEEEYIHTPEKQAKNYSELMDSLISFYSNNTESPFNIFFFCSDVILHTAYYPPVIREYTYGKRLLIQRLRNVYTIIDTSLTPLPAFDTIFAKINIASDNDGLKGASGPKIAIDGENFYLAHKWNGQGFARIPKERYFWDKKEQITTSTSSPSIYKKGSKLYTTKVLNGHGYFCKSSDKGDTWGGWILIQGANDVASPIHIVKKEYKIFVPPISYRMETDICFTYINGDSIGITKYTVGDSSQSHYNANYIEGEYLVNPITLFSGGLQNWKEYYIYEDNGVIKMMEKDKIPPDPFIISETNSCHNPYAVESSNKFYVVWVNTTESKVRFRKYTYNSWGDIQDVTSINSTDCEKVQPTVVVYPSGGVGVMWSDMVSGRWNIYLSESEGGGWTEKMQISGGLKDCSYPVTGFKDSCVFISYIEGASNPVIRYQKLEQGISADSVHITYLSANKVGIGHNITVRWECPIPASYTEVYLTRDGGNSWSLLDSLLGDPGEYTWRATGPTSNNAHFRIKEYSSGGICKSGTSERFYIYKKMYPPDERKGSMEYIVYGQGDISTTESGVISFNKTGNGEEFGLRRTVNLSPNKEYHLLGYLKNSGSGKIGMGIGEGNNRVKIVEVGGGSPWSKEYAIITTVNEISVPLDLYANSSFSGTGYVGGVTFGERVPLEVTNLVYLTKFGGEYPSTVTVMRDSYTDSSDVGDTLIYSYHNIPDDVRLRFNCNGCSLLLINNQNIGTIEEGINDISISQSGDITLRFIGDNVEVEWIGLYTRRSGSKWGWKMITLGDIPKLLFQRTVGRDIVFFLEGADGKIQWKIYDVVGRKVEEKSINAMKGCRIHAGKELPCGIYFIRISGVIEESKKVVIIR